MGDLPESPIMFTVPLYFSPAMLKRSQVEVGVILRGQK